jgi:hypothetical protein
MGSMSEERRNLACKVASMTLMKRWLGRRILLVLSMGRISLFQAREGVEDRRQRDQFAIELGGGKDSGERGNKSGFYDQS